MSDNVKHAPHPANPRRIKSILWSIIKYVVAVVLLIIILRHAGMEKVTGYLKQIPPLQLLIAFILITLAQVASGLRMRYFFLASGFPISLRYAIHLFYVGAIYNFLLPGGIGGDAYKVILAHKRMKIHAKQGIRIMLADRASGLCVIMFAMFFGLLTLDFSGTIPYAKALVITMMLVTLLCYLIFSYWLLKKHPMVMLGSLLYSLVAQGFWMAGLLAIWSALGNGYGAEYIVLYCAANIIAMIPATPGGLGIKESAYLYGAPLLQHFAHSGVDGDRGIAISLCMFFLMLAASMPGLLWLNKVEKSAFD